MLFSVFSVYDTGANAWRPPVFVRSKGLILREFAEAVNNPESDFAKHPSDYTLFELGTFDDDKCKFNLLPTPVALGIAIEFVKPAAHPMKPQELAKPA